MIKRIFTMLVIFAVLWGAAVYFHWIQERDAKMIAALDTHLDQLDDVPPEHLAEYLQKQGLTITGGEFTILIGDEDGKEEIREGSDKSVLELTGNISPAE